METWSDRQLSDSRAGGRAMTAHERERKQPVARDAREKRKPEDDPRKLRRALQRLSDAVLVHLAEIDALAQERAISRSRLADVLNWMEMHNDDVRYAELGVSFRTDDKTKATKKARRALGLEP